MFSNRQIGLCLLTAAALAVPLRAEKDPPSFAAAVAELKRYSCYEIDTGTVTTSTQRLSFGCHSKLPDAAFPLLVAFPSLEQLDFISDKVSDAGLAELKNLPRLRVLHINSSTITDKGLESLKGLPKLEELSLMRTQVTAKGLATVRTLKGLKTLGLIRLKTTPALIEELKGFKHLARIYIGQTQFTDAERAELAAALPNLRINKN